MRIFSLHGVMILAVFLQKHKCSKIYFSKISKYLEDISEENEEEEDTNLLYFTLHICNFILLFEWRKCCSAEVILFRNSLLLSWQNSVKVRDVLCDLLFIHLHLAIGCP